jgi:hypothetical protein
MHMYMAVNVGSVGFWVGLVVLTAIIAPDAAFFIGRAIVRATRSLPRWRRSS